MMYYIMTNLGATSVVRVNDNGSTTFIPDATDNADWLAYQEWLAEGNTPEPWPPAE